MRSLTAKALGRVAKRLIYLAVLLFVPARTIRFPQGWVLLTIFLMAELLVWVYLLKQNPELLQRRLKGGLFAEGRVSQKIIILAMNFCFTLIVVVPALDHRYHWSHVPTWLTVIADAGVLLGFLLQFYTLKENTFASAVVAIVPEQRVISTGPYAAVRHPMYAGSLLVHFCTSLALGSLWGLPVALGSLVAISLRLLDEEKLLRQSLPGYEEYRRKVQSRLIPGVW